LNLYIEWQTLVLQNHIFPSSLQPLPKGGELPEIHVSESEATKATMGQDGEETEEKENIDSTYASPLPSIDSHDEEQPRKKVTRGGGGRIFVYIQSSGCIPTRNYCFGGCSCSHQFMGLGDV
jgi:hypothetical protein